MESILMQDPRVLEGCVYYSQNREDLVLSAFFADIKKGFYVDVGAFDPNLDSVTKLFYLKGWRGINVEPQKARYEMFKKDRKRDTNLNIGIAAESTTLTLRTYKSEGLSTFSDNIKKSYEESPDGDTSDYVEHTVAVRPLKDVFAECNVPQINFLKVDVEGLEYQVLASNDWKRYRPQVLCIEANHVETDWHPLLADNDYELVFNDGLNEYFVDKHSDRVGKFDYVKEVVHDRGGGIRADHLEAMVSFWDLGRQKAHHVEELAKDNEWLIKDNEKLQGRLKQLEQQVEAMTQEQRSIRLTSRRLAKLAKRNVLGSQSEDRAQRDE